MGDNDADVTINSLSFYKPAKIPNTETQVFFNEAISKTFTTSYESWTTDRKPIDTARKNKSFCVPLVKEQKQRKAAS